MATSLPISKLNIVIVDDSQSSITLVEKMIKDTGWENYVIIHKLLWVQNNCNSNKDTTLKQFIDNKIANIDIAMVDLSFDDEFLGKDIEAGGVYAANLIKDAFPNCPIIFVTDVIHKIKDGSIIAKFEAEPLVKSSDFNIWKARIESAIKKWIKSILFDIKSSESSTQQCLAAINSNSEIGWNAEIYVNNRKWSFENLFFIYKKNVDKLKEIFLSENGLGYMPSELMNFKKNDTFQEDLIDYFKLLYFNKITDISVVKDTVSELLNILYIAIKEPSDDNINNLQINLKWYNIASKVPLIFIDKDAAFKAFEEKLIIRLFFISAYIIFGIQAKVIYQFFNNATVSDETIKQISTRLFIRGMLLKESIDKGYLGYKTNDDRDSKKEFRYFDRKYSEIIKKSCMKYEKDFIIEYYKGIQSDYRRINKENANAVDEIMKEIDPKPVKIDGKFSWLHISDLHFQNDGDWDTKWNHLCESIKLDKSLQHCSYVFITGDIGHKGVFPDVTIKRLDQLRKSFDSDTRPRFFWSFGNHDISFAIDNTTMRSDREDLIRDSILIDNSNTYEKFKKKIHSANFQPLLLSGFDVAKKIATEVPINSVNFEYDKQKLNGFYSDDNLNICVLNTSIVATETSKPKQLFVATDDLSNKLSEFDKKKPTFVLAHHPFNWMEDTNAENVEAALSQADIYLCGHEHKVSAKKIAQGCIQSLKEIVAGSASGVWENLVIGARFNLIYGSYNGHGEISIRCYTYSGYGWIEDTEETNRLLTSITTDHEKIIIERLLN